MLNIFYTFGTPTTMPQAPSPKFAYFGTPEFSTLVLEELVSIGYVPALVVTSPDKPAGRGLAFTEPPVKTWARAHDISVLQPETFDEAACAALHAAQAEFFIVAAYGKILPAAVLALAPRGALNIHPSLLPRYRGTSPVESQILADEKEVGVSVIQMDEKMDHGPVVAQKKLEIPNWPVARGAANSIFWKAGGELLGETLPDWLAGKIAPEAQDESRTTFAKKIKKEDGEIQLADDGRKNYLMYLAYEGWPGVYFFENRKRVKVTRAKYENGAFVIERVIPEGKREMGYADFRKGG